MAPDGGTGPETRTVTFLLTDVQGSTRLWEVHPEQMNRAMARHHEIVANAVDTHGGHLPIDQGEGDARFAAFPDPAAAVACAVAIQLVFESEPWPTPSPIRIRMGLHTGDAILREGNYFGESVSRCARIRGLAVGGQILISQATRDLVSDDLPDLALLTDLGLHRLKDLSRPEQVFQLGHSDLPDDFPPLVSLDPRRHNLPVALSSFVGRERELSEIDKLLEGSRLVTITGAGGSGKTRIATRLGAEVLERFAHGVWFVDLADLQDPAPIPAAIAQALGLREEPGKPVAETVIDYLRPKTALVLMDNCEHVIAAAATEVENVLAECADVHMLATSREPLNLTGEVVYALPTLEAPPSEPQSAEELGDFEAVRLFMDRAQSARPDFALTSENAGAVARICMTLDGIPLALELAAARMQSLSVEQIADRLGDRFRLLTRGSRSALPRHQTLRSAVDWSYELLGPQERKVFASLGVFAGSISLEAAEAVCAQEHGDVLDLFSNLVQKSLVQLDDEDEGRYRLLEVIRQYALEKLAESESGIAAQKQHRDFYLDLVEKLEIDLQGPKRGNLWIPFDQDHANIVAALEFSIANGDAEELQRFASSMGDFWASNRHLSEGRRFLNAALSASNERTPLYLRTLCAAANHALATLDLTSEAPHLAERTLELAREMDDELYMGRALVLLGYLDYYQGRMSEAGSRFNESLPLLRRAGTPTDAAEAAEGLAAVDLHLGHLDDAETKLEDALALHRSVGRPDSICAALQLLASVLFVQGRHDEFIAVIDEALALAREIGESDTTATLLRNLGRVSMWQGDFAAAEELLGEALEINRDMEEQISFGDSLSAQGELRYWQGRHEEARELLERGMGLAGSWPEKRRHMLELLAAIARDEGDLDRAKQLDAELLAIEVESPRDAVGTIASAARTALACGDLERAAKLGGAAEALGEASGRRVEDLPLVRRRERDEFVRRARAQLDSDSFEAAWSRGRAMSVEDAFSYARDWRSALH